MPAAQSFGGGADAGGGAPAPAAGAASGGGGAAPPRQQRPRAKRGQATDPHSIAERVRHLSLLLSTHSFNASAICITVSSVVCCGVLAPSWSSAAFGPCSCLTCQCQPQSSNSTACSKFELHA
jgi:hypothetical protein